VRTLAGGPARFLDVHATDTRFYAVPIVRSGRRVGTLVTGVSLAPYEHSVHLALLASIVFALASLAGVALAAVWIVGRALHPVARMTADASDWSEHDLDKRFLPGEPHDELTRLAATFDGLLDRLAAGLRREQSFSAELSHELRTPLARLVAETDLALRRERTPREYRDALEAVQRAARQMDRTLETLIVAARAQADLQRGTSDAVDAARRAVAVTAEHEARDDVAVTVAAPPSPLRVGADADLVERILAPLVENGVRHATTRVVVEVHSDGGRAVFVVADDGPGVAEDDQAHIFEPGVRAGNGSARRDHPGAGLGLPLARRLARAAGGDVECVATPRGGRFRVRLPRG
jgi:signal transduction histidine kinase